jgi:hypothetical protein
MSLGTLREGLRRIGDAESKCIAERILMEFRFLPPTA